MYLYLLIFWLGAGLAYVAASRRASLIQASVFGVFLMFFMGARGNVGCDTRTYAMRYDRMYRDAGWMEMLEKPEALFNWLNMGLIRLGLSYQTLLMACAAVFSACLYRFSKLSSRPMSFMVLAFPVLVVQLGMSGIRQAMALAFLMLALVAFVNGRRLWVAAWIVMAWQFHSSVIVFLPIALLAGRQVSAVRLGFAMVLLSPVVAWFLGARLEVYSDRYVEQIYGENSSSGAWFRYVLVLIPFLVLEWKRRLVRQGHPEVYELLRLFSLITFALLPIGLLSSVALHRMVFYVMPVSILALLCVADTIFVRSNRRMAKWLPFLAYGGYITMWFLASKHSRACYVPYETWLT